ncbi:MAG: molybdopterin molybdotransferase MoeA, partial [Planctomycetaceae bacterium]
IVDPDEAIQELAAALGVVAAEHAIPATGRVLAEAVVADRDSPASDVSAMDGYAIRIDDLRTSPVAVAGEIQPGRPPVALPANHAMRIFTGAVIPQGAEAVVMREDTDESSPDRVLWRERAQVVVRGENIRYQGENGKRGDRIVDSGSLLTAASIAALANFGASPVALYRPVKVTILVTGNELCETTARPEPWQLRDSNGPTLAAVCAQHAWLDCRQCLRCPDDASALERMLRDALSHSDAVLLTGGVSKGDYDYVPAVIAGSGARIHFHGLPIRPGRPILGAVSEKGQLILGLPGNPVSALVGMTRFGVPLLARQSGQRDWQPLSRPINTSGATDKTLPLHWFRLVSLVSPSLAQLTPMQGSGDLVALARSTGFIHQPPGASGTGPWPYYPW